MNMISYNSVSTNITKRAIQLACQSNTEGAFKLLEPYIINKTQRVGIDNIFQNCKSDPLNAPNLQKQLAEVLKIKVGSCVQKKPSPQCIYVPSNKDVSTLACAGFFHERLPEEITLRILSPCDVQTLSKCSNVNNAFRKCVFTISDLEKLQRDCPNLLLIDTGSGEMPLINCAEARKWIGQLNALVRNDAGCSLLIMREGLTLNQMIKIAEEKGIKVKAGWDQLIKRFGEIKIQQTCAILITNHVFKESQNKTALEQHQLVNSFGCEIPTMQEYIALHIFAPKQASLYEQDMCVRSSTSSKTKEICPLTIRSNPAQDALHITINPYTEEKSENMCVGAKRLLSGFINK